MRFAHDLCRLTKSRDEQIKVPMVGFISAIKIRAIFEIKLNSTLFPCFPCYIMNINFAFMFDAKYKNPIARHFL